MLYTVLKNYGIGPNEKIAFNAFNKYNLSMFKDTVWKKKQFFSNSSHKHTTPSIEQHCTMMQEIFKDVKIVRERPVLAARSLHAMHTKLVNYVCAQNAR